MSTKATFCPPRTRQGSGAKSFYHVDGLGSTRALTDASGVVTARYLYDAFGRILAQSGPTVNSYLFAGQQRDSARGWDYLRARYYDPSLGCFTAADPLRGSLHDPRSFQVYGYGMNDPVNRTDPSGLQVSLAEVGATFSLFSGILFGAALGGIQGGIAGGWKGAAYGAASGALFGGLAPAGIGAAGSGIAELFGLNVGRTIFYTGAAFTVMAGGACR